MGGENFLRQFDEEFMITLESLDGLSWTNGRGTWIVLFWVTLLNMVTAAITGTLEEMNKSCETCIHDKDVAGILFTWSHHFYGDLFNLGKGMALHLLRGSGLFFSFYRCWVQR